MRQPYVGLLARAMWLVAVLLCAQPGDATTGVALFVKSFVVIASDGMVNQIGPKVMSHINQCKVVTTNGTVAIVSGMTDEEGVHFNAQKILSNAMEQSGSVYEAANMAARQIARDLPGAIEDFRKNNPNESRETASGSLQILMAGMSREGEVQVARRSISYDRSRPVQTENTSGSKDHIGIAAIGESSAIDEEVERLGKTDGWAGAGNPTDLKNIALRFIALEVVDKPETVGPPVSIVLVDSEGIHWLERGACQQ